MVEAISSSETSVHLRETTRHFSLSEVNFYDVKTYVPSSVSVTDIHENCSEELRKAFLNYSC